MSINAHVAGGYFYGTINDFSTGSSNPYAEGRAGLVFSLSPKFDVELGNGTYAAKMCSDLVLKGFDDWFLPSKEELRCLFDNQVAIGRFSTSVADHYWSSSELTTFGGVSAHIKNSGNGDDKSGAKNVVEYRVRAVRAFKVLP